LLNSLFSELEKKGIKIINENIDYNKEQLSLNLNIKYVDNLENAISHIQKYSSKHSD
jgi:gamma-glutamyl phosphate reductase